MVQPVDVVLSNHYTSTHPDSWFTWQPVIVKRDPDAIRSILGRTYTVTPPGHDEGAPRADRRGVRRGADRRVRPDADADEELAAVVAAPTGHDKQPGRGRGPRHVAAAGLLGRGAAPRRPPAVPAFSAACSGRTERSRVNPGSAQATSSAPAMQASPPETTDTVSPKAVATAPASRSPRRGPPATTAICTPISRPRIPSGPANWMIVFRNTADSTSAQPATASSSSASGSQCATPNPAIDAPQTSTAHDDREPLPPDPADPAAGQRAEQRAGPGRGVEQPDGGRAAAEDGRGERGEQRPRHAEHHRVHVDQVRALHRLGPPHEPQPLERRPPAGPRPVAGAPARSPARAPAAATS